MRYLMIPAFLACAAASGAAEQRVSARFERDSAPYIQPLPLPATAFSRSAAWTMSCWVRPDFAPKGFVHAPDGELDTGPGRKAPGRREYVVIGGIGNATTEQGRQRMFFASATGISFWEGQDAIRSHRPLQADRWQFLTATSDGGTVRLYVDGEQVAEGGLFFRDPSPVVTLAPILPWNETRRFTGVIADFVVSPAVLSAGEIAALARRGPPNVEHVPAQPRAAAELMLKPERLLSCPGQFEPQDVRMLPRPKAPLQTATRKAKRPTVSLDRATGSRLELRRAWELIEERRSSPDGAVVSRAGFDTHDWYDATVPGTVLTTLVEQGVYPDPLYGLNNLAIPETLNKQDWWYRSEFEVPPSMRGRRLWLDFGGINYRAEIWVNGHALGRIHGAFQRGAFDVTDHVRVDERNAVAVRIEPPPHTGIPVENNLLIDNRPCGGWMPLDGPTFYAAENWDWIPGIRDRNIGVWQPVVLRAAGEVTIEHPFVRTKLPLPDTSRADLTVRVTLRNHGAQAQSIQLRGRVAGKEFVHPVELAPRASVTLDLSSAEHPELRLASPELWWPNGYGKQPLYTLDLTATTGAGVEHDRQSVRFGVREVSCATEPSLTFKVNGRPVIARGGSWGMDDAMKRVSRERLEPSVRLQRDANLNLIRTWCGQSIEPELFELCDEYGIMVWCELWMTTFNTNHDPVDIPLLLANMEDTILRYRNHPSIVVWGARNEGAPPPEVDQPLAAMVRQHDGTRFYQPNSNGAGMGESGPWKYQEPADLFARAIGFPPERGLPSVPTADSIRAMMPAEETWPISDAWAYHDFPIKWRTDYLAAIERRFGPARSLDEFCRFAQVINFETHRALYEGINQRMFDGATGTMLWMSHPAWPSMIWQLYSWDHETHASFYGARKANESLHIQFDPTTRKVSVVNHGFEARAGLTAIATVHGRDGRVLGEQRTAASVAASRCTELFALRWPAEAVGHVGYIRLQLSDASGFVTTNTYWFAEQPEQLHELLDLPAVPVQITATSRADGGTVRVAAKVQNSGAAIALMTKLTVRDASTGARILPCFYTDNYVTLLPGETGNVEIEVPGAAGRQIAVTVEGWNALPATVPLHLNR